MRAPYDAARVKARRFGWRDAPVADAHYAFGARDQRWVARGEGVSARVGVRDEASGVREPLHKFEFPSPP